MKKLLHLLTKITFQKYIGYDRNNSHILNCYLRGVSKLRQVTLVAPSRLCLTIAFQIQSVTIMAWTGVHCTFAVETFFKDWWIGSCYTERFSCSFHVTSELCFLGYKFQPITGSIFYPEQHLFDVVITDSLCLKMANASYQKKKMIRL